MPEVLLGAVQPVAHGVLVQLQVLGGRDVAAEPERRLQGLAQPRGLRGVLGERAELGADEPAGAVGVAEQQDLQGDVRVRQDAGDSARPHARRTRSTSCACSTAVRNPSSPHSGSLRGLDAGRGERVGQPAQHDGGPAAGAVSQIAVRVRSSGWTRLCRTPVPARRPMTSWPRRLGHRRQHHRDVVPAEVVVQGDEVEGPARSGPRGGSRAPGPAGPRPASGPGRRRPGRSSPRPARRRGPGTEDRGGELLEARGPPRRAGCRAWPRPAAARPTPPT